MEGLWLLLRKKSNAISNAFLYSVKFNFEFKIVFDVWLASQSGF